MIVRTDSQGWDVGCNILALMIDVVNKRGMLVLPENHSPDMRKTIECFRSVDPEILRIEVEINNKLDIVYDRTQTPHWVSLRMMEALDE
jgi:hypothetical protein